MKKQEKSKGEYLVDIDESRKWKITPEKAIKNMKKIVIGFIVIAGIVAFVVQINVDPPKDLVNAATLSVEIIFGIFIALVVYVYSKRMHQENKKQQKRIEKLITNIEKIEKSQEQHRQEIQEDVAVILNKRLSSVNRSLKQALKMYENYVSEKNIEQAKIWKTNMKNDFDRCHKQLNLEISLLELMKIFGRGIARQYWQLLIDLGMSSDSYDLDDGELSTFENDIKACLEECERLKKEVEPLTSLTRT